MVTNVFKRQPKYEEDWRQVVSGVLCTLSTMSDKLMGEEGGAVRLDGQSRCRAYNITMAWVSSILQEVSSILQEVL